MSQAPEASEPAPLKALRELVQGGPPAPGAQDQLLRALEEEELQEHGLALLRQLGPGPSWEPFRARLKVAAATSRARRMQRWQTDPHRRTVRILFEAGGAACALHPPALVAALARSLLDAGLPLAMGLEKSPRPAVHLGHPLPMGVPGRGEWADAMFTHAPPAPAAALPGRINAYAVPGLTFLALETVPNYATPVAELCRAAQWRWSCPHELLPEARTRVEAFLAAPTFELEKAGKTGGQKGVKRIELRSLVETMAWDHETLAFTTRIAPGQAPNPQKLLGAILGREPGAITGLERLALTLAEDPRLQQADRFEPKLHNMYEDAVLLDSGAHIKLVDGDDDDPIVLGG